ncbi:MAG: hypothetical protein ABSC94_17660 [Polyangiaceae bacterium]|jgi:hypothetical protein
MTIRPQAISIAFGVAFVLACETDVPPQTAAASVEQLQCDSRVTAPAATELLQANAVLSIKPLYHHIIVNPNNAEDRIAGAKLLIRPPAGVSAEELTRILQCHSARVLLGKVSPAEIPDDPYWLADRWLDIQVTPENGNFAVTLVADSVHDNIEVLGRATRFAHEHMLAVESVP